MNDKVDFLYADKYGSFLEIDTMIFDEQSSVSKVPKFSMNLQYFKKEVRDKVDFLDADKDQSFPS